MPRASSYRVLRCFYRWCSQFADPLRIASGLWGIPWYLADWRAYSKLPGAEHLKLIESYPQFHDRSDTTPFDRHYFFLSGWAMRRIMANRPSRHADVASLALFVNMVSAILPVAFVEFRPLPARLAGLDSLAANMLALPFLDNSIPSLSCLHAAEHVGLGRYGDPLDPAGTQKAAKELARVLAPGGHLYFAVPVGKQRVCFNAHRVHNPQAIIDYFAGLELREFSAVCDQGDYWEHVSPSDFSNNDNACGLFWFSKRELELVPA